MAFSNLVLLRVLPRVNRGVFSSYDLLRVLLTLFLCCLSIRLFYYILFVSTFCPKLFCSFVKRLLVCIRIFYYYYSLVRAFHISDSRWFFTGVWVTASLLKSPELFSVYYYYYFTNWWVFLLNLLLSFAWKQSLGCLKYLVFHTDWFFMAYQPVLDYFIHRSYGIVLIARLYLHFYAVISCFFFVHRPIK